MIRLRIPIWSRLTRVQRILLGVVALVVVPFVVTVGTGGNRGRVNLAEPPAFIERLGNLLGGPPAVEPADVGGDCITANPNPSASPAAGPSPSARPTPSAGTSPAPAGSSAGTDIAGPTATLEESSGEGASGLPPAAVQAVGDGSADDEFTGVRPDLLALNAVGSPLRWRELLAHNGNDDLLLVKAGGVLAVPAGEAQRS